MRAGPSPPAASPPTRTAKFFGVSVENGKLDRNSSSRTSSGASSPSTVTRRMCWMAYPSCSRVFLASHDAHAHPATGWKNDSAASCISRISASCAVTREAAMPCARLAAASAAVGPA